MSAFGLFGKRGRTPVRAIDERFSTAGQIRPEEVADLAQEGFAALVCARPDNEEPGQPAFAEIARAAESHGMKAVHIPVSGAPTPDQVERLRAAMATIDGPVLGYCRSGARSATLYTLSRR